MCVCFDIMATAAVAAAGAMVIVIEISAGGLASNYNSSAKWSFDTNCVPNKTILMYGLHEFDIGVSFLPFLGGAASNTHRPRQSPNGSRRCVDSKRGKKIEETPSSISWSERPTEREIEVHTRSGRVTSSARILRGIGRHLEPPFSR